MGTKPGEQQKASQCPMSSQVKKLVCCVADIVDELLDVLDIRDEDLLAAVEDSSEDEEDGDQAVAVSPQQGYTSSEKQ